MPSYSVAVPTIVAGANPQTLINLFSIAALSRARINNIVVSASATPDDKYNGFVVKRTTGIGTEGGGQTPVKLDPDTQVSAFDAGYGHSVEPTETAGSEMLSFSLNQRASFSWLANPGSELILPAIANNGANISRKTGDGLYTIDCTIIFEE